MLMTVEEYLAQVTPAQRAAYEQVKAITKELVPEAEEKISYAMPTLTYKGKYLIYWGAFKNHMGLYPGTYKFTENDPVPEAVVKEIVLKRYKLLTADKK